MDTIKFIFDDEPIYFPNLSGLALFIPGAPHARASSSVNPANPNAVEYIYSSFNLNSYNIGNLADVPMPSLTGSLTLQSGSESFSIESIPNLTYWSKPGARMYFGARWKKTTAPQESGSWAITDWQIKNYPIVSLLSPEPGSFLNMGNITFTWIPINSAYSTSSFVYHLQIKSGGTTINVNTTTTSSIQNLSSAANEWKVRVVHADGKTFGTWSSQSCFTLV